MQERPAFAAAEARHATRRILPMLGSMRPSLGPSPRRNFAAAIRHADRLVGLDPLRESHHQLLIRLHAENQDRASAMRAYHQCMRTLRRELAVEPGPETRALFEKLLKAEPIVPPRTEAPSADITPRQPMIGRKAELTRLSECWRAAANGENGRLIRRRRGRVGRRRAPHDVR